MPSEPQTIERLYLEVDRQVARLEALQRPPLNCRAGCAACCVDDLTVFTVEAAWIAQNCQGKLHGPPRGPGGCAFLDDQDRCRIYAYRPYVCRTQGLPLRWLEAGEDQPVERRDICSLNEPGRQLVELPATSCWTIGPVEEQLGQLQGQLTGGDLSRISLRGLAEILLR